MDSQDLSQLTELINQTLGSQEAVRAILQGVEYGIVRANTNVWSHLCSSIRRKREGIPFATWEPIGNIMHNTYTREMTVDMENVSNELYQRAFNLAVSTAIPGRMPKFDQKVFGLDYTYWVVATTEGHTFLLAFYRRPKYWPLP